MTRVSSEQPASPGSPSFAQPTRRERTSRHDRHRNHRRDAIDPHARREGITSRAPITGSRKRCPNTTSLRCFCVTALTGCASKRARRIISDCTNRFLRRAFQQRARSLAPRPPVSTGGRQGDRRGMRFGKTRRIVLGPGMNIKRSPLGGRGFEYFSEDPFLTSAMATGLVEGIQSCGVGRASSTSHATSQEIARMVSDSIVRRTRAQRNLPAWI